MKEPIGDSCSLGGGVPNGFIPLSINTAAISSTLDPTALCGMCVFIEAGAPETSAPQEVERAVIGSYFGYVYDTCEDCGEDETFRVGFTGEVCSLPMCSVHGTEKYAVWMSNHPM